MPKRDSSHLSPQSSHGQNLSCEATLNDHLDQYAMTPCRRPHTVQRQPLGLLGTNGSSENLENVILAAYPGTGEGQHAEELILPGNTHDSPGLHHAGTDPVNPPQAATLTPNSVQQAMSTQTAVHTHTDENNASASNLGEQSLFQSNPHPQSGPSCTHS